MLATSMVSGSLVEDLLGGSSVIQFKRGKGDRISA